MRTLSEAEGVVHSPRDLLDEHVVDLPDRLWTCCQSPSTFATGTA